MSTALPLPWLASPDVGACNSSADDNADPRTDAVRYYCYGVALPCVCVLGVLGNVLNLLVLTRRNMRGPAYVYMRGYSAAALLAILFAIPFGLRVLIHKEAGRWTNLAQAFYHAHLELFLGNACLGVGVMMLLALTVERYVSVCRPGRSRALAGPPRTPVLLIPLLTFGAYLPTAFRTQLRACLLGPEGQLFYRKVTNERVDNSLLFAIYKVVLEVVFKVGPTLLLAALNLRIMLVYRRSCDRRRRMTLCRSASSDHDDPRHFAEERRLVMLLGSTSILFLVCVSPMVILNLTLSERNLSLFSYQVFRAIANLLEVTNYSLTFYIYCLFSEDFRSTLLRTLRWPGVSGPGASTVGRGPGARFTGGKALLGTGPSGTPPTTTTTTTTNNNTQGATQEPAATSGARRFWQGLRACAAGNSQKKEQGRASV